MSYIFHQPFEAAVQSRRRFSPLAGGPAFSQAKRHFWIEDEAWTAIRRAFAPIALAGNDVGRTAALTLSFTGKGDDPFLNLGVAVDGARGLGADPTQVLAVEILAAFAGQSAARIV